MRKLYQGRRDALVGAVRRELGDLVTVVGADAGLHLSVLLPPGVDDREVLRRAASRGVTGSALSSCYAGRRRRSGLILGFGGSDERGLREAMATLASVIRALA
jgi:GntR family transcriptional regulator/MocR family aminotransferase